MVRKLFKHELKAYLHVMLFVWLGMLGVSVFSRIVQFFEQDSTVYNIVFVSSIVVYVIGLAVCFAFPFVFAIVRFYKNLFTGEGYLSFTLPVTPFQHIWVKVATATLIQVATVVVMLLSGAVLSAGEVLIEIFKACGYILNLIHIELPELSVHLLLYIFELILMFMVANASSLLLYYTCICIGQLSKKNRILTAVGVYFGYYFVCQILQTIAIVIFTLVRDWSWLTEPLVKLVDQHPYLFVHLLLLSVSLVTAGLGAIYFVITHTIMRKKLNLE